MNFKGYIEIKPGLYYCKEDGTAWSNRKAFGNYNSYLKRLTGKTKDGYHLVSFNKKMNCWHRLVYEYFHGNIPSDLEIDHINNNKSDNRIENLQLLTHKQNVNKIIRSASIQVLNGYKKGKMKNNTSGYPGVSWDKKSKKFKAYIYYNLKYIHLGLFDNPEEAFICYLENKIHYHGWDSILPLI
jgi:hypothetical protein